MKTANRETAQKFTRLQLAQLCDSTLREIFAAESRLKLCDMTTSFRAVMDRRESLEHFVAHFNVAWLALTGSTHREILVVRHDDDAVASSLTWREFPRVLQDRAGSKSILLSDYLADVIKTEGAA